MLWILSTATPAELGVTAAVLAASSVIYAWRASRLRQSFGEGRAGDN
jgi:hypothetical protein